MKADPNMRSLGPLEVVLVKRLFFVHPSSMQVMGLNWASLSGRLSLALSRGLVLVEVWDSADVGSGPTGQLLAIDLHPKAWGPLRVLLMFSCILSNLLPSWQIWPDPHNPFRLFPIFVYGGLGRRSVTVLPEDV